MERCDRERVAFCSSPPPPKSIKRLMKLTFFLNKIEKIKANSKELKNNKKPSIFYYFIITRIEEGGKQERTKWNCRKQRHRNETNFYAKWKTNPINAIIVRE